MTRPATYLIRMGLFLLVVAVGVVLLAPSLLDAFMANPVLNGIIVGALAIGIAHSFRSTAMLQREVTWIESFQRDGPVTSNENEPRLLAPMARMFGERAFGRFSLSTMALRTLLDGIATRLDEVRETSRYMTGLLVFLGLLGTFWGLLQTIDSIGSVISGLTVGGDNTQDFFGKLKDGLQSPLSGMGTAFSSSLFGLAGSLILGFLALQAGQAQNRFYNELEEWLSSQTRLGSGALGGDGDASVPAFIQALLEQTADSLESLQRSLQKSETSRLEANQKIVELTDTLVGFGETMKTEQQLMLKLAEGQEALKPAFEKLANAEPRGGGGGGGMTAEQFRSVEKTLGRIAEELSSGRAETISEIRSEIRLLARTIAALADE
jgi:hypothetical protein